MLYLIAASLALLAPASPAPLDTKPADAIAALLADCEAAGFSGVIHVQKGSQKKPVFSQAFGWADSSAKRPCTEETLFEIASITKPITAAAFLHVAKKKRIDLDESISKVLTGVPEHSEAITPRHLLLHTAGMPGGGPSGRGADRAAAVATYLSEPPSWPVGTRYEYWNGGYAILAAIIEEQSGKSFEEYVRKHVFKPAGMGQSGFTGEAFKGADIARGETPGQPSRLANEHPYGTGGWHYRGMGGVVTTAADLARFMAAFANGKLVPSKIVKEATEPNKDQRGLGWEVIWDFASRAYSIQHGGSVRGFRSTTSMSLGDEIIVVVLSNGGNMPAQRIADWVRATFHGNDDELAAAALPPRTVRWKPATLEQLAGQWTSADGTNLSLTVAGERSLRAQADVDLASAAGSGADPIQDAKSAYFSTVGKRNLSSYPWEWKAVGSTLEWNGKKGEKAALTLTTPDGKSRALRLVPPAKGGNDQPRQ